MPIIPQYPAGAGNSYEKTQLYPLPTGYRSILVPSPYWVHYDSNSYLFPAGAGYCSQSLLGTVMKKYMEYPAGAGYSTQQEQGTL